MSFVDEARIYVKAGDGGKGCESFYRDKFMRYPRPDGGDGGKGGNVVFVAAKGLKTLLDYRFNQHYKASRGGHASSKGKKGKDGADCVLRVPVGTILKDYTTGLLIKDLTEDGQSVIVALGGKGGIGNKSKKGPTSPESGQEKTIFLELKLVADIGIIGCPNAGKSTLISSIAHVKSKIAAYPFTTRQPILGVVQLENSACVISDLPGLIKGAHKGRGLGDRFLRHAERTKVLLHLIDMAGSEGRAPLEDYQVISDELRQYSDQFLLKKQLIVANKIDLPQAEQNLKKFKKKYQEEIIAISALERINLDILMKKLESLLSC